MNKRTALAVQIMRVLKKRDLTIEPPKGITRDWTGSHILQMSKIDDRWQGAIALTWLVDNGYAEIDSGRELQGPGKALKRAYSPTELGMKWTGHDDVDGLDEWLEDVGVKWVRVPTEYVAGARRVARDGAYEVATIIRKAREN